MICETCLDLAYLFPSGDNTNSDPVANGSKAIESAEFVTLEKSSSQECEGTCDATFSHPSVFTDYAAELIDCYKQG
jgi:hypothetical protein